MDGGISADVGQISNNEGESSFSRSCIILCPARSYLLSLWIPRLPLWFGNIGFWRSSNGQSYHGFLGCLCCP
ncbi:MAG: hypothetical protein DBX04_01320 [Candidatus Poseidoniales archaeon]|nr:MAG: hypothetical protein DBX04_01320 [Candidatus Poseidoniales archaeon]